MGEYFYRTKSFSVSGLDLLTGTAPLVEGYPAFVPTDMFPGAWFIVAGVAIAVTAMTLVVLAALIARNAGVRASNPSRRSFDVFVRDSSRVFKFSGVTIILGAIITLYQMSYFSLISLDIGLPGFGLIGELCLGIVVLEQGSELSGYAKK